ncbi:MAG: hypothetical protein EI684_02980 [Candidatus Viridilinea halotolerans]|uniref:Uncharacterized protein n=1 Tax=Candidatus Viridilinea halotolerans TaxID=2491704 RepID=A0A426U8E3_9CHLR|nr:MAG: hypothetical protein EI684_02980 [Candidatus Viridilinea halotolerans]
MTDAARLRQIPNLAQIPLVSPEPLDDPGADDPAAMVLDLRLPHDDDLPRHLAGFTFFWLRYVWGFRAQYHCASCLAGRYDMRVSATMPLPARMVLDNRYPYAYLCGVASSGIWANNFHLPVVYAAGEQAEAVTYHGVRVRILNAQEVPIPWIEAGWNGFPLSYTTCRNWQFGVHAFGYCGESPTADELSRPEWRTQELADLAWKRQRMRLSLDEVRAALRAQRHDADVRDEADEPDEPDEPGQGYILEHRLEYEEPPDW